MDPLTPLLKHLPPTVEYYFSGAACAGSVSDYDGKARCGHLHLVKSGTLHVTVAGSQDIFITRPSVLLFPRPCAHTMLPGEGGVELVCGMVELGFAEQSPLALSLPECLVIEVAEMPAIGMTLELLYAEAFGAEIGRQTAINRLLEYFMLHILRHLVAKDQFSQGVLAALADPRLALALNAMHERPSQPWTLEQLASIANMSRARFAANFQKAAGIPPLDYLTNWRLSIARGLLRQGRPLKSVASAVGYQSSEAFGRVFVRRIGQTPTAWMRLHGA